MNILACFKLVRDFEQITPTELSALRDGTLAISAFKKMFGSYDEAALEHARRLAAGRPSAVDCKLDAVTVGDCESRFAKELYAIGFDQVFQIGASDNTPSHPREVAENICRLVEREGGYDAILTGRQAWPGESGLTPYFIAKRLGLPCISQVIDLNHISSGIRVLSKTDRGTFAQTITVPAVYSMGEAAHPYLQIATLREKLTVGDRSVLELDLAQIAQEENAGKLLGLLYEDTEKQCRFLEGETVEEKAQALWQEMFSQ